MFVPYCHSMNCHKVLMIRLCVLGRAKYVVQNWEQIQKYVKWGQILNFCGCRGLSVTTENCYVYRRMCMWLLCSQSLFYSGLFYAFFFNAPWHCLTLIYQCFVVFSLTRLLVLCCYANPLHLMGIIFSPSPARSFSLPGGFSFSFFLFSLLGPLPALGGGFMFWVLCASEHP